MRKLFATVIGAVAAASFMSGETPAPIETGPAVGVKIPSFSATDQTGTQQSLQSILGPKGALLVFFRSADW